MAKFDDVGCSRQESDKSAETMEIKHYISSSKLSAKDLLENTRAHWSIESVPQALKLAA